MRKKEIIKRYIIFIIGLFINSLGVSMITKANLGTSPISSIPYVLSLHFPLTLGQFTIIFSILLIVLQLIISEENAPICIAIGRQYGCGGHEIGKRLAEKLGLKFYDSEIIKMVANTTNYSETYIDKRDEKMTNCSVFDLINYMYEQYDKHENPKDEIFNAEVQAIKKIAEKGNCVIIGRCADYILKNQKNCLTIFLFAPIEYRIKEVAKRKNISEEKAKKKIHQIDRLRANNYQYYTHQIWGVSSNYQLCIDTSKGEKFVDQLIITAVEEIKNSTKNEKTKIK